MYQTDTIAAISTAPSPAAIGILRLSGPQAVSAAQAAFSAADGRPLGAHPPRTLVLGALLDREGAVIDQVLAVWSPAPNSYTGEETAELHCHGAPTVLSLGLETLLAHGARQARAGEFTRRAFLNGKLDLLQAEAVADLLDAASREGARHAAGALGGALSRRLEGVYSALTDVMAHFHAVLDYPDEDIDPFRLEELAAALEGQERELDALLATCRRGAVLRRGLTCPIVGRPNAGKSSLLNALAGYDRSIVTDVPGTTRDTVEAEAELGGLPFRLIDTAAAYCTEPVVAQAIRRSGVAREQLFLTSKLRNACHDPIEQLGVERSRAAMEGADLIFVVWDASAPVTAEDRELLEGALAMAPAVLVWSKCDLPAARPEPGALPEGVRAVALSARTGAGLEELERAAAELARALFPAAREERYGELLANRRQEEAARRARESVGRARAALLDGVTPDALLTDVEQALAALGELTGRSVSEDVTDRIFQRFCVGK